jgi:hypothetical protein
VRIKVYAEGYNARHKRDGQHRGPITRAFMEMLDALLWGVHNCKDGRCFPSYESLGGLADVAVSIGDFEFHASELAVRHLRL